ncbi:phage N-6-adenine-methyltransferase [Ralstonia pseudosolanacearum]|uniref:phage N-6-adenine-methyltransferase n=1 Tax=Ralstonia pseudosolanacearum TaxID=1310165 RepID=UPI003CF2BD2F
MKDFYDIETIDFAETGCSFTREAIASGGYYQALKTPTCKEISGRRYKGTNTPDVVRDLWSTPREVIAYLEGRYGKYDLDAAASEENKVCEKFYSQKTNCLKRWWGSNKHIWLNPTYSHPDPFVKKAIEQMEHNNQIDMLLPGDNSTAWFAEARRNAAEIIWIEADITEIDSQEYCRTGRLAFISGLTGKPVDGNNKGSVIFVMRKLKEGETQKTTYVSVADICPGVSRKKPRKRSV